MGASGITVASGGLVAWFSLHAASARNVARRTGARAMLPGSHVPRSPGDVPFWHLLVPRDGHLSEAARHLLLELGDPARQIGRAVLGVREIGARDVELLGPRRELLDQPILGGKHVGAGDRQ